MAGCRARPVELVVAARLSHSEVCVVAVHMWRCWGGRSCGCTHRRSALDSPSVLQAYCYPSSSRGEGKERENVRIAVVTRRPEQSATKC